MLSFNLLLLVASASAAVVSTPIYSSYESYTTTTGGIWSKLVSKDSQVGGTSVTTSSVDPNTVTLTIEEPLSTVTVN